MIEEYVLGKNGEILETLTKEEFMRRFPNEHFEIKPEEMFVELYGYAAPPELLAPCLKKHVEQLYKDWGRFGPYGDVISITQLFPAENDRFITILGRRAFPSPKLAVDCVIFVRDEADNYFFVGIERSKNPGKGKAALVGGFLDVNGYDMETDFDAVIREIKEEVGITVVFTEDSPYNGEFRLRFSNNYENDTRLTHVGDTETGDEEKLEHLGVKRVHRTSVFSCLTDIPGIQTSETVSEYFKAGSDAAKLAIIPFSPYDSKSVLAAAEKLAISHHKKMFLKAVRKIFLGSRE